MHKLCAICGMTATAQIKGTDYCSVHLHDFIKSISIYREPGVDVEDVVKSIVPYEDDKLSK